MFNKKGLLAAALCGSLAVSALAGCSGGNESKPTQAPTQAPAQTTASNDATSEAPATEEPTKPDEGDKTIAPKYAVEAGKVIDFEDGNFGFVQTSAGSLTEDVANVSVADFNGSKALKVVPTKTAEGINVNVGFDVTSILGAKAADVASVQMQIGVAGDDGKFYACAGNIYMSYADMANSNGSWTVYMDNKNPAEAQGKFASGKSYDTSAKNVMIVSKANSNGNNCDTAFAKTGKYSTMYIDNVVFFDADGNAIDVKTDVAFDAPDDYGKMDWSNLIDVSASQVIIPGWADSAMGGWKQGEWHQNICVVQENVQAVDENGNPMYEPKVDRKTGEVVTDENGNIVYNTSKPVYVQKIGADGEPETDADGNPVCETKDVEQGEFDFGAIMKPGTVFTLYYNAVDSEDLNHYIWFVFQTGDADLLAKYPDEKYEDKTERRLGWQRLLDGPTASAKGIDYATSTAEEMKPWLFTLNDSHTMAQVTYDQIRDFFVNQLHIAEEDLNWEGMNFSLQAEAGMDWNLTAVTYALNAY